MSHFTFETQVSTPGRKIAHAIRKLVRNETRTEKLTRLVKFSLYVRG
jgi:hypothetical protein